MSKAEISICIPTYKRPKILAKTLEHLASASNLNMEVVVSDNVSNDGTAEVVKSFEGRFSALRYYCQKENVGGHLNSCAAFDMATSEYLYWLSDDDHIISDGILTALGVAKKNPDVLAVFGGSQELDPETNQVLGTFPGVEETMVTPGNSAVIFNQSMRFFFPVAKTSVIQRFYRAIQPGVSLFPLVAALSRRGSIALIPDLLYTHIHTHPRSEYELTENWYQDTYRGDLELSFAEMYFDHSQPEPARQVAAYINKMTQHTLLQGYRFACIKKQYLRQRYFIHRANAYGLMPQGEVAAWEREYILFAVAELIKQTVCSRPDVFSVVIEKGRLGNYIHNLLRQMFEDFPATEMRKRDTIIRNERRSGEYLIVESYDTLESRKQLHPEEAGVCQSAIYDLIMGLRVTNGELKINI